MVSQITIFDVKNFNSHPNYKEKNWHVANII
jgi:hypothetical protein